ncbi:MAG: DNA primase DnaG [Nanoarchaeota archaeon]|nr:DNA primase [Nanoarchaeota archaeon]MBU1031265.1 DNA primase [Nanoarchaeota archaeon]MBU1850487.1 DNA primase [Nanoarchaeota archaeon]
MAKIAQVSAKYIVHADIQIEGVVDKPDVIGAIFGQTEGLLGADLELRELQRSGRIGRIEVNTETKGGKTTGEIIVPSSLDKAETSIVGAALEIIQRIGPCNAKIRVEKIEDVRVSKRLLVVSRAKELLKELMDSVLPDSQELSDEVAYSVRVMEIQEFGKERLPAGPSVEESDEIIVVEGRADVLNLLKHGFKNVIAMNGTNIPQTIIDLSKEKILTIFVDGDRGGDLIIKELFDVAEIDFVTKAPDGKEVEEITKKEIHKALRSKISAEQARMEIGTTKEDNHYSSRVESRKIDQKDDSKKTSSSTASSSSSTSSPSEKPTPARKLTAEEKQTFNTMLEDLIGTRGAYVLDDKLNILGKVPISELQSTIKSLRSGICAVVLDGIVDKELLSIAERARINFIVAMESKAKSTGRVQIITGDDLQK